MTVAEFSILASPAQRARPAPAGPRPQISATPDELARFFRDNYPTLLDGAGSALLRRRFLDGAESSLAPCTPGLLPQAVLREALERVTSTPRPTTPAGAAVIGPKAARVWWDGSLLAERLDAMQAGFDRPRPVIRFFDVTGLGPTAPDSPEAGPHHEMFDIDVDLSAGGKTVQFWRAARTYGANIGLLRDGGFAPLARIGVLRLPADGPAAPAPAELVRSNLRPARPEDYRIAPDAAALAWAAARPDFPGRDIQAELALHMLYRAFLADGPGALRRRVALSRRDNDVLTAEYASRRSAGAAVAFPAKPAPAFLVAVLDPGRAVAATAAPARFSPAVCAPAAQELGLPAADFAWLGEVLAFARSGAAGTTLPTPAEPGLVSPLAASGAAALPLHHAAEPVFQAAGHLRARLAGLREESVREDAAREDAPAARQAQIPASPTPAQPGVSVPNHATQAPANRPLVAGTEPARLARAGVRVTRLSLAIEGRMRPGARLRVAGKLVSADADGNFHLECLLTGRRAAVPMRAGDAVSSINVSWEKRPIRAKSSY